MKQVTLFRHAKSSWKYELEDVFRPLNRRGYRDAKLMAEARDYKVPDQLCCSPAIRTYSTALYYLKQYQIPINRLHLDWALYEVTGEQLFTYLQQLNDSLQQVWLFGHNPGFNELIEIGTGQPMDNMVTGASLNLCWQADSWKTLTRSQAALSEMTCPPKQPAQP